MISNVKMNGNNGKSPFFFLDRSTTRPFGFDVSWETVQDRCSIGACACVTSIERKSDLRNATTADTIKSNPQNTYHIIMCPTRSFPGTTSVRSTG